MRITFERVSPDQHEKVAKVYELIRDCGREMLEKQGLSHWGSPIHWSQFRRTASNEKSFGGESRHRDIRSHFSTRVFRLC